MGLRFLVALLATWRVAHLVAFEDGPSGVIARLRGAAGAGSWASIMDCFKCLSLWIAAPLALYVTGLRWESIVTALALSGGAMVVQEALHAGRARGEKENVDELLWSEKVAGAETIGEEKTADRRGGSS
jgi:hypothetical protein